jgi:hypothetical protein
MLKLKWLKDRASADPKEALTDFLCPARGDDDGDDGNDDGGRLQLTDVSQT